MRKILAAALCAALALSAPATFAQKRKAARPAKERPQAARFIVNAAYEESYAGNTKGDGNTSKWESRLTVEIQASRWLTVRRNDAGGLEFWDSEGGEPEAATMKLAYHAVSEERQFNDTGPTRSYDARADFSGTRTAESGTLSVPHGSDIGDGLEFDLGIAGDFKGDCEETAREARWDWNADATRKVRVDDDVSHTKTCTAGELLASAQNEGDDKATAPLIARYGIETRFVPDPYDPRVLIARGEMIEGNPVDMARKARIELARQLAEVQSAHPRQIIYPEVYGSKTTGDGQAGFKINFLREKAEGKDENGGKWQRKTKLSLDAVIIPGGPAAAASPNRTEVLREVCEERTWES